VQRPLAGALTLSTFDATTGKLTGTLQTVVLGSKVKENTWYPLTLDLCSHSTGTHLSVHGGVMLDGSTLTPLDYDDDMPGGIDASGQAGIAGQAKSSFVDSSVREFSYCGEDYDCECNNNPT
jgi:hypothetical protein